MTFPHEAPSAFSISIPLPSLHLHVEPAIKTGRIEEDLPMTSTALKLYAIPAALLMLSAGIAAPGATAEPAPGQQVVHARFVYKPGAAAAQIYADFRATAERACRVPGPRPASLRKLDERCAANLLQQVLQRVNRTDLAAIHANETRG